MRNMPSVFLLAIMFLAFHFLPAQKSQRLDKQIFAYVQNEKGREGSFITQNYKYEVAKKVFDELIRARGDYRMQLPGLIMSGSDLYVAWMAPVKVQIGLEEKAYEVCASFGKDSLNALAALLAHEITHYYEKHDWTRHFVEENEELETGQKLQTLEEGIKHEIQADYLGGFLAYSAGYNTFGIMPEFLEKIYEAYGLPEAVSAYPTLDERKRIAKKSMERLTKLVQVFETANYLVAMESYSDAATYHRYILKDFQSREIFNNAGVNVVLEALKYFDKKEVPYVLPVELDVESRMAGMLKDPLAERIKIRKALLQEALHYFERAAALDDNYAVAPLNMGCIYTLLSAWEDAVYFANKARRISAKTGKNKISADAYTLQGIIAAGQGDEADAAAYFDRAIDMGSSLASINKDILTGNRQVASSATAVSIGVEKIENLLLEDYLENPETNEQIDITTDIICGALALDHSSILIHYAADGERYAVFHTTRDDYPGKTSKGIALGAGREQIVQLYQQPKRTIALSHGIYLIYPLKKILFYLDENDKLKSWTVFRLHFER